MVALSQPDNKAQRDTKSNNLSEHIVTVLEPTSAAAEAYRTLRTSLLYTLDETQKLIVVTSPEPARGKSPVCANLGVALALAQKNTLIVDCDLRNPAMHEMFGLDGGRGIADVLVGKGRPEELYRRPISDLDLKVLTAGVRPSNPAELLLSPRVSELFARVRTEFDYVIVDSPPTGLVSDPLVLATLADGVLLSLDSKSSSKRALQRTMRDLNVVGASVLGTVVVGA